MHLSTHNQMWPIFVEAVPGREKQTRSNSTSNVCDLESMPLTYSKVRSLPEIDSQTSPLEILVRADSSSLSDIIGNRSRFPNKSGV